ncbi:MAG: hypothetical protein E5V40_00105 [Mesorhizobium sp.]|nr:MAG: hypothetical protein E5V40_00105 [Mesorhizobium sp.]
MLLFIARTEHMRWLRQNDLHGNKLRHGRHGDLAELLATGKAGTEGSPIARSPKHWPQPSKVAATSRST